MIGLKFQRMIDWKFYYTDGFFASYDFESCSEDNTIYRKYLAEDSKTWLSLEKQEGNYWQMYLCTNYYSNKPGDYGKMRISGRTKGYLGLISLLEFTVKRY
jgi:hypothetical protein